MLSIILSMVFARNQMPKSKLGQSKQESVEGEHGGDDEQLWKK